MGNMSNEARALYVERRIQDREQTRNRVAARRAKYWIQGRLA